MSLMKKIFVNISFLFIANSLLLVPAFAQAQADAKSKIEASDARDKKHQIILGTSVKLSVPWWDSFVTCATQASVASTFYTQNKLQGAPEAEQYVRIFGDLGLDRIVKDRKLEPKIAHEFMQEKFSKSYQSEAASISLIIKMWGNDAGKQNVEKWKPICFGYVKEYKEEFAKSEPQVKTYLDALADKFPK